MGHPVLFACEPAVQQPELIMVLHRQESLFPLQLLTYLWQVVEEREGGDDGKEELLHAEFLKRVHDYKEPLQCH